MELPHGPVLRGRHRPRAPVPQLHRAAEKGRLVEHKTTPGQVHAPRPVEQLLRLPAEPKGGAVRHDVVKDHAELGAGGRNRLPARYETIS